MKKIITISSILICLLANAQPDMDKLHPENKLYYKTVADRDASLKQKNYKKTIELCNTIDQLPHWEECGNGASSMKVRNATIRIDCYSELKDYKKVLDLGLDFSFQMTLNGYPTSHYDALKKALQNLYPDYKTKLANLEPQGFKIITENYHYPQIKPKPPCKLKSIERKYIPMKILDYTIKINPRYFSPDIDLENMGYEGVITTVMESFYKNSNFYKVIILDENPRNLR